MVLQMFGSKEASIPELIAKKKYAQAIDLLKKEIKRRPQDEQVQIQLADILILDGKQTAAAQLYRSVADTLAERGFAAKAIALLKKVQRIEGASVELEQKLASLIKQSQPAEAAPVRRPPPPPPPMFVPEPEPEPEPTPEIGIAIQPEEYEPLPENLADETPPEAPYVESYTAPPIAAVPTAPERQASRPLPPPPPMPVVEEEEEEEEEIRIAVEVAGEEQEEPSASVVEDDEPAEQEKPLSTPLFADFSNDELLAVMRGLELHSFEPGDIIVTQGEPGDSLFILASGMVKAYVRKDDGTSLLVRTMFEGDFFGEIALLTGKERTATITAATNCDLLELDRATLDDIASRQPTVRKVLMDFYNQRAQNAAESMVQAIDIAEEAPEPEPEPAPAPEPEPEPEKTLRVEKPKEEARAPQSTMKLTVRETPKAETAKKVTVEMQEDLNAIILYDTAISATRASNWADAFPLWKEYVAIKPDDKQAASVLGVVCAKLEKWEDAIVAFRNAAKLSPGDSSLYYNLGVAYAKLLRWAEATKAYEKAVQLKPDYEKAKQSLANARKNL
ncbi:MAG TPA: cyclic nucleotide-binding domain-containing protein [Thermoanaerobaculia bacterium]